MGVIGGGVFQAIKGFRNAPWSIDRGCAGCLQWPIGHGGLGNNGRHSVGPHRGCWHRPHLQQFRTAPPFLEDPSQLPPKEGTPAPGYPSYQQYH
ncbi:hypothetical protein EI555_012084 [Monodon monoceros]|uniref:Uncharacterized protein n=1 Tax=Monodon monoceros TaxID=40151 RepID=A0A4V5P6I4_MONMO|nr:hypothetical protein EI555_012084 [Monodon monoceros]